MKNLWNSIVIWFLSFNFLVKRRAKKAMVYRHNYSEAFHKLVSDKLDVYPFYSQKEVVLNNVKPVWVRRKREFRDSSDSLWSRIVLEEGQGGLPEGFLIVSLQNEVVSSLRGRLVELVDKDHPEKTISCIFIGTRRINFLVHQGLFMRFNYNLMDIDNKTLQWVSGAICKKDLPISHILREGDLKKAIKKAEYILNRDSIKLE